MKQKFHIKPDGSIGICKAEKRKCKYGGQHFEDFESAQRYADRINSLSRKEKLELYQPFKQTQKEKIVNITKNILKLGSKNEGVEDFHLDNPYVSHTIEITKDNSNGLGFQIKICSTESWDSVKYKIFEKDKYYFTQEIIGDKKVNPLHNLSDNTKKEILSNIHELVKDTDPEIKEELGKNADRFSFSSLTLNHYGQQSDPTDLLEIYYHNGKRNFFATGESKSLKRSFSSTIQEPYKPKPRQLKKVKINNPLLKDEKI